MTLIPSAADDLEGALDLYRGDLLEGWQRTVPENAPNHFLINIQPDQVEGVREFLSAHGVTTPALYPMVRARLTAINSNAVVAETFTDDHARRRAELHQRQGNGTGDEQGEHQAWLDRGREGNQLGYHQ